MIMTYAEFTTIFGEDAESVASRLAITDSPFVVAQFASGQPLMLRIDEIVYKDHVRLTPMFTSEDTVKLYKHLRNG